MALFDNFKKATSALFRPSDLTTLPTSPGSQALAADNPFNTSASAFQGPGTPISPTLTQEQQRPIRGRQYDFPSGSNLSYTPKRGSGTSYADLRALARGCDMLRIVIESRKDEICRQDWKIQPTNGAPPTSHQKTRIATLTNLLKRPDQENDWDDWLRMLIEDLCVIDAMTIYPQYSLLQLAAPVLSFHYLDGATIDRVIDNQGRTPPTPYPAYRQIIKGAITAEFTRDQLIYAPRNRTGNSLFGFSPVEQVMLTVNMAIRKSLSQLSYYTDGSVPDLLFECPPDWNMSQIQEFNTWWQDCLSGNTPEKRKAQFIPSGAKPFNPKDAILKDKFDEWLARIICYAFNISNIPFIDNPNRSISEAAQEAGQLEGLKPLLKWLQNKFNRMIQFYLQSPDLEFCWLQEVAVDPKTQADIDDKEIKNGTLLINEQRQRKGLPPLPDGDIPFVLTAAGCVPLSDIKATSEARINPPNARPQATDPLKEAENRAQGTNKDTEKP